MSTSSCVPGEVHALVGENGAGKSTLMKIVDGLYAPDEGALEVGGEAASFSSPRDAEAAGIAMIPQELDLFPELSVAENLFVGRKSPRTALGRPRLGAPCGRRPRAGWTPSASSSTSRPPVKRLSAANRQIVAIARALVGEARAVIMDEPTASLTEREADQLFGIIEDLTRRRRGRRLHLAPAGGDLPRSPTASPCCATATTSSTAPASELDPEELVRLMVGRPLNELFTRSESRPRRGRRSRSVVSPATGSSRA